MAQQQIAASTFDYNLRVRPVALVPLAIALAILTIAPMAYAQTLSVLHTFTGGGDGGTPFAGLTIDEGGNFYGTTSAGGYGTVFKLSHVGTGWILNTLYKFQGGNDGGYPYARVVFGPDGLLYGTTSDYGISGEYGTVFSLQPPASACRSVSCPWTKTVLYHFTGAGGDGASPGYGDLAFDAEGNIYGTTFNGGGDGGNCSPYNNCGVVFKLTRLGGSWTESVLWSFSQSGNGGCVPESGVVLDSAGNLYGTTFFCGADGEGVVYQLTQSGSSWTETVLHTFEGSSDGGFPFGGLLMDQQGNLYGSTTEGPGGSNGGTVYELQPSGDSWTYRTLTALSGDGGPADAPTMDAAGNLYFTSNADGTLGFGNVFKLTPSGSTWVYTDLHDFNANDGGYYPSGSVALDAQGNLYGTTPETSASRWGEIWKLTP
jgi:uncharacterized repeat protein (TIGR03803 family)